MNVARCLLPCVIAACTPPPTASTSTPTTPSWIADTSTYTSPGSAAPAASGDAPADAKPGSGLDVSAYRAAADKIIAAARADRGAYEKLAYLTDHIGNRISGSRSLDRAIAWAKKTLEADGHDAHTEPVKVPHWVRGRESASITSPISRPMSIIGLGGTIATPRGGITAPVMVVHSFDELDARSAEAKGKIVLYDVPMPKWTEEHGSGYGDVVGYRTRGAQRAAPHGAVAVLMRSVTAHSLYTPHTGAMRYDPAIRKIPAAAVTVEDSELIARLAAAGPVTVHLALDSKQLPDAPSANVIGELRGREKPDEIVVIGAHIDSWDVGQGANDDGAGCVIVMQALTTLRKLGLTPRRTVRVVLYTNEENGLAGGRAYAKAHAAELPNTVLAIEADQGSFAPRGFGVEVKPELFGRVTERVAAIAQLLAPLDATHITAGHGGADISSMAEAGVPMLGLDVDSRTYFDTHHTNADTLDKVDPVTLAADVAAVAVMAYVVAEMPGRVDR